MTACNVCGRPGRVQALDHPARPVCGPCWVSVVELLRTRGDP
jgi:hypothetical protein